MNIKVIVDRDALKKMMDAKRVIGTIIDAEGAAKSSWFYTTSSIDKIDELLGSPLREDDSKDLYSMCGHIGFMSKIKIEKMRRVSRVLKALSIVEHKDVYGCSFFIANFLCINFENETLNGNQVKQVFKIIREGMTVRPPIILVEDLKNMKKFKEKYHLDILE